MIPSLLPTSRRPVGQAVLPPAVAKDCSLADHPPDWRGSDSDNLLG